MRIAGIDCSSFAIDIVTVPLDDDVYPPVQHFCFKLGTDGDAFDRTRRVGGALPGRTGSWWDEILAVGIEQPGGHQRHITTRVQGAVLAMIPSRMLVHPLQPSEWRKGVGLPGNATKERVFDWVTEQLGGRPVSQDAADAYCMALATRELVLKNQAKEAARAGIA